MSIINQKNLVRYGVGFLNIRFHFLLMTGLMVAQKPYLFSYSKAKHIPTGKPGNRRSASPGSFSPKEKSVSKPGTLGKKDRMAIAIYQENNPAFIFAHFGAALANCIVFAVNTGFRGETLSGVINQSGAVPVNHRSGALARDDEGHARHYGLGRHRMCICRKNPAIPWTRPTRDLDDAVEKAQSIQADQYLLPIANTSPMIVIYTSGMTGLPKGVPCTHIKLYGAGLWTQMRIRLNKNDRGYISMPLFHSNAHYVGIMPLLLVGGSFVLKRKFSASAFEEDMLKYGVTYLNYVGSAAPLHYHSPGEKIRKRRGRGEGPGQSP